MKRKNLKPLLISLSTLTVIAPVAVVVSCGSSSNDKTPEHITPVAKAPGNTTPQVVVVPKSVETLVIQENQAKDNVWHADQSNSIVDALEQMNQSMHIFFPKKLADMTPFEFAQWLVDIYNNNGSGHMNMIVDYKGQQDKVVVDFKQPLLDVISTFKDAHISESTPRTTFTTPKEYEEAVMRMVAGSTSGFGAALSLALQAKGYDGDLFLTSGLLDKLKILQGSNPVAMAMFPVIAPFPDSTMHAFIKIIDIFHGMAQGFIGSPVALQWAKDHNIEADFNKIDHLMIQQIMKRAI